MSPPVTRRDCPTLLGDEEDGDAVGGRDAEQNAWSVREMAVRRIEQVGWWHRLATTRHEDAVVNPMGL